MTIRSSLAALIAVFSAVLLLAQPANAQEQKSTKKEEKPPVIVVINAGDTLTSIAEAHATTYVRIFNANDTIQNPDIINVGDKVRIPTAEETLPDRHSGLLAAPVAYAPAASTTYGSPKYYGTPSAAKTYSNSAGNTYARGYCTWYAKERRPDLPNMLGNGGQWVSSAAARGYATGTAPRAGAIAEMPGHVAYVESVNGDGSIVISDMNGPQGFGVVGTRTASANQFRYIY